MEKSKSRVVVNLSTGKYIPEQARLVQSVLDVGGVNILAYKSEAEIGAPSHHESPYAFKLYAMREAVNMGYRYILWLDASMLCIAPLDPVFDIIEQDGYFFQDSGWGNARWTPQYALEYFGTNEGVMFSSGFLGLDMESEVGQEFFAKLVQAERDGMFRGSWEDYRHDQSAGSLIAYKMGLKLQPPNTWFVYGKLGQAPIVENTVCLADGIV